MPFVIHKDPDIAIKHGNEWQSYSCNQPIPHEIGQNVASTFP